MVWIVLFLVWIVGGALIGWGVPKLFKSEPPYGLAVDLLASILAAVLLGVVEWSWILPALGFTGPLKLAAALGDPLGLSLIVLWLLRRAKG
ncbi:MAG: hypothetical protein D6759_17490 [Chloroflexi bacterium]|nr:MAG: hypothetical protein D6759_17490 [Chloroflexota bacterium]